MIKSYQMKKAFLYSSFAMFFCVIFSFASFKIVKTDEFTFSKREKDGFKALLQQFPKGELPFAVTKEELSADLMKRTLKNQKVETDKKPVLLTRESYDFLPLLAESRFSRMPVHGEPIQYFETPENFAVIYNLNRGYSKARKNYCITVFDKKGNHVSSYYMAQLTQNERFMAASVDKNLNLTIDDYAVEWAEEFTDFGLENNKITGLKLKQTYVIDLKKKQDKKNIGHLPPSVPAQEKVKNSTI